MNHILFFNFRNKIYLYLNLYNKDKLHIKKLMNRETLSNINIDENAFQKDLSVNLNESFCTNNTFQISELLDIPSINCLPPSFNIPKNPIFKIINEPNKKRKRNFEENNNNKIIHDKYSKDNIRRRINVHFFKFIIQLCNDYIKKICKKKIVKFKKAECNKIVSDVTIQFNHDLRNCTLSYILCKSTNVTSFQKKNSNVNLIKLLKEKNNEFSGFFSLTIGKLYDMFVSNENEKKKLKEKYGLKKAVTMNDYIKNRIEDGKDDKKYEKLFKDCAIDFFGQLNLDLKRRSSKQNDYKKLIN